MRLKLFLLLSTYLSFNIIYAQDLQSFIGVDELPADDAVICEIPLADPELEGIYEADTIHDFRLYDLYENEYVMSDILQEKKPVLLISCSYTCFVFRSRIERINYLNSIYGDSLNIYLVYTVEAHPVTDISPYFGYVNTSSHNYEDNVLYRQPTTYLQRKHIVHDMLQRETISVPVLIDGPCNYWWENFGKSPNCAFLIDTNGIVFEAEKWFDRFPDDIQMSIQEILEETVVPKDTVYGEVEFPQSSTDCISDEPGAIIFAGDYVVNNDVSEAIIDISISDLELPADWNFSICTDVCYPPGIDSVTMVIEPGDSMLLSVHFYTSEIPNEFSSITMELQNQKIFENRTAFAVNACTTEKETVEEEATVIELYPNPASEQLFINSADAFITDVQLYQINGQLMYENNSSANAIQMDVRNFPVGIYFLHYVIGDSKHSKLIAITH
ncbi:MAG: T9SS type A sorting domain-containing protein [Chitinophagales bacterium]|nr:T9SS type A sorting domain-containing protein [Bacteroidota bacterium]